MAVTDATAPDEGASHQQLEAEATAETDAVVVVEAAAGPGLGEWQGRRDEDEVYSREDGSFRRADGTYGHWGTDGHYYYVGFWGEDGQYHEGYRDSDNVYWEGYWTDDGQWVDLSAATPTNNPALSSLYSSILNIQPDDDDDKQDTSATTAVVPPAAATASTAAGAAEAKPDPDEGLTQEEKEEAQRVKMQKHVTNEILATERAYVKDLAFVVERFQRPMVRLGIIDPAQSGSLFSNLHLLKGVNESLLAALEKHDAGQSSMGIGAIFSEVTPYFKMYSQYINNIDKQERLYNHLYKANSNFRVLCDSVRALPESKHLDLPAYLAKPMQRICKYPLLFRELVRFTLPTSPERKQLEEVCATVAAVAQHINEMKAKAEDQQKLAQLLSRLDGSALALVTATRRYLQEGSFVVRYNESSAGKKSYLFLFSDAILLGSPAGGLSSKIKPKRFFILDDQVEVVDVTLESEHIFEIVDQNPRVPDVARVWAESKEQKDQWVQSIRKVLTRFQEGTESKALNLRPLVTTPRTTRAETQGPSPRDEKGGSGGKMRSFIVGLDRGHKLKRSATAAPPVEAPSTSSVSVPLPPVAAIPPPLTAAGVPLSLASFPFPPLQPRSHHSRQVPGIRRPAPRPPPQAPFVPQRPPPQPPSASTFSPATSVAASASATPSAQPTSATTPPPSPPLSTTGGTASGGGLLISELHAKLGQTRQNQ